MTYGGAWSKAHEYVRRVHRSLVFHVGGGVVEG